MNPSEIYSLLLKETDMKQSLMMEKMLQREIHGASGMQRSLDLVK